MPPRPPGIPLVALGLVTTSCFGKADDDDDDDYSDVPLLGEDGTPGAGDGDDGGGATDDGTPTGSGEDSLVGDWVLTEADGAPYGGFYTYDYGGCTLTYGRQIAFVFEAPAADEHRGALELRYVYEWGGDCDYDYGSYSYSSSYAALGTRRAVRSYAIAVDDMGLEFDCELRSADLDDMDCDYGGTVFLFERGAE